MAGRATTIPIRVIPGSTELVKDTSSVNGEYHLNIGFHISFNVKELMHAMAEMTDTDVTIKADASVPMGKGGKSGWGAGAQDETPAVPKWGSRAEPPAAQPKEDYKPPQRNPADSVLGGPLKQTAPDNAKAEISWETPLNKLSPATAEYWKRVGNTYQKSEAKFLLTK